MDKAQLKQKILDALNGMSESELVKAYQNGCNHYNCPDDMIFPMDEFDELEGNQRPFSEVYRDLTDDFSFNDEYYYLDGYAHYHSLSDVQNSEFLADAIDDFVESAIDDEFDFGSPKIAEIFEEAEDEEDE